MPEAAVHCGIVASNGSITPFVAYLTQQVAVKEQRSHHWNLSLQLQRVLKGLSNSP